MTKHVKGIRTFIPLLLLLSGSIVITVSIYYGLNKAHIGAALIIPVLLYWLYKNLHIEQNWLFYSSNINNKNSTTSRIIALALFITLLAAILAWQQTNIPYHRPLTFFLLVSAAAGLITAHIFLHNINIKNIVLVETILLGVLIRASLYFLFPTVWGNDPFFHISNIETIIAEGFLPKEMDTYVSFPYFHILITSLAQILGCSIKTAYFIPTTIGVAVSALFAFLLGNKLATNEIGLLSALLIVLAPYHILWDTWIIPMSLGVPFATMLLYLILCMSNKSRKIEISILIIFLSLSLVLIHTVASFVVWLIYLLVIIGNRLISRFKEIRFTPPSSNISYTLMLLFTCSLFAYWIYANPQESSFFSIVTRSLYNRLYEIDIGSASAVTLSAAYNYFSIAVYDLPFTLFLLFGIMGMLVLASGKLSRNTFILVFVALSIIAMIYGQGLVGLIAALPGRWFVFAEILLVVFAALGVYFITSAPQAISKKCIASGILIFVFSFSAITTPINNSDSPIYAKELATRSALYESEVKASEFALHLYEGSVSKGTKYLVLKGPNIDPRKPESYEEGLIAIRNFDLETGFIIHRYGSENTYSEIVLPTSAFLEHLCLSHVTYKNSEVTMYLNRHH